MTRIQLRHDTAANFASVNPVLLAGEVGVETDTNKMKIGDGTTAYNSLDYFAGGGGSVDAYTKAETDELLDEKQNVLNPVAPINIQDSTVGTAYVASSGQIFSGNTITETIYLFNATPTTPLGSVDFTKSFEVIRKNVVLDSSNTSFIFLIGVRPGVIQDRHAYIYFYNDSKIHADSTLYNNTLVSQSADIISGSSYDFRYYYNGTNTTQLQYKLSSADTWNTLVSSQYTYADRGFNKYIQFSGNEYVKSKLSDITFINDGNTLFSMTPDVLSLSIGSGLAVQNGNLVNTVDVSNKVTGTGITNMIALTQAEYDALTTKDANTFYVIVAASS